MDRQIGIRLRLLRNAACLSQSDLASRVGITFQQMQKYENGINRISFSMLVNLSQVLTVPLSNFYPIATKSDNTNQAAMDTAALMDFVTTHEGIDLAKTFMAIKGSARRKRIIAMAEALAEPKFEGS
jgi:transcriptional regulator with XRE-family HTH domain